MTSEEIGWKKKFKEDVLRRNPDAFAESLNASPRCVRESMHLLEKMGLIKVILQPVESNYGVLPNVMHINICPDMRKYLRSGSDVLRQKAIDWASEPLNQCQLVKKNGQIVDIKWVDF